MKKAERILGTVAVSLFALGVLGRLLHLPGAALCLSVSLLLFNLAYLPLNLIREWRGSWSGMHQAFLLLRFVTYFILVAAFVFKIMHWPGGNLGVKVSNVMLPALLLFYFYLRLRRKGELPFYLHDLIVAAIAYGIHMYVVLTMLPPGIAEAFKVIDFQYQSLNAGIRSANRLIYESLDSISRDNQQEVMGTVQQLREETGRVIRLTDSLNTAFLQFSANTPYSGRRGLTEFTVNALSDGSKGTEYFLLTGNGAQLEAALDHYLLVIRAIASRYNLRSGLIGSGLETEGFESQWGMRISWIEKMFVNLPVATVSTNLSWQKLMILMSENAVLTGIIGRLDLSEEAVLLQQLAARESDRVIRQQEDELTRMRQLEELQRLQLEQAQTELRDRNAMIVISLVGIAFVILLLIISTRAYLRKQRDNKKLTEQSNRIREINEALNQRNEEITAQRDEIEAQRDEIEAQRDTVSRQKEQIETSHREITASIEYAMRLQSSILPTSRLLETHFSDHFILFRPRDKVSGDFYWWTEVEEQLILAVADCTGHGVPGAFMSMLGISLLREIVIRAQVTDPGQVLEQLRKEVIRSLHQKGEKGEQKDGLDITLLNISTGSRECRYAAANNSFYLVREGRLTEQKADLMPISLYDRMEPFRTRSLQLEGGDQLFLFSDGYADQFGGKDRTKLKYPAFRKLLLENAARPHPEQKQRLEDHIIRWQGSNEQIDDMTVIGLKVK